MGRAADGLSNCHLTVSVKEDGYDLNILGIVNRCTHIE